MLDKTLKRDLEVMINASDNRFEPQNMRYFTVLRQKRFQVSHG
jgi:hypothetical protein